MCFDITAQPEDVLEFVQLSAGTDCRRNDTTKSSLSKQRAGASRGCPARRASGLARPGPMSGPGALDGYFFVGLLKA